VPLKGLFEKYGRRGFGALARTDLGIKRFLLQFRSVDAGQESEVQGPPDLAVSSDGEIGLQFCPSCGTNLELHYGSQMDRFPSREALL
jgi:hypothetical protein